MCTELLIESIKFIGIFLGEENIIEVVILIKITREGARFIGTKSIQESFIIWAYIVYMSD